MPLVFMGVNTEAGLQVNHELVAPCEVKESVWLYMDVRPHDSLGDLTPLERIAQLPWVGRRHYDPDTSFLSVNIRWDALPDELKNSTEWAGLVAALERRWHGQDEA